MAEKSIWQHKKDAKWFLDFWYYYKKHVLAGVLVLICIVATVISCARKVNYDLEMYCFDSGAIQPDALEAISADFESVIVDADKKDGKNVFCWNIPLVAENKTVGENSSKTKIILELAQGKGYLFFMNQEIYDFCLENNILEDISAYVGEEEPVYAVDVTENEFLRSKGFLPAEKIYMAARVINKNNQDDEFNEIKHKNALKVIEYMSRKGI